MKGLMIMKSMNIEIEKAIAKAMILNLLKANLISDEEADKLIDKAFDALSEPLIENSA